MFRDFHETSIRKDVLRKEVALRHVQFFLAVLSGRYYRNMVDAFTSQLEESNPVLLGKDTVAKSQRWSLLIIFLIFWMLTSTTPKGSPQFSFTPLDGVFFFWGGSSGRSKLWNTLPILQEPWKWFAETCSTVFYWAYVLKQETLCVYIYISLYRNISASSIHIFICRTSAILDASDCVFDDSMCIPTICCTSLPRNPSTSSTRSQADSHFGCHDGRRRGFGPWGQGHCCQVLRGWVEWGRLIIFTCFFGKMYPIYIYTVGVDLVNCHVFWRGKPTGSFPSHVQQTALRCCVAGIQCFLRVI